MKKTFMFLVIALVASLGQSAQLNWGITGQVKYNSTLLSNGAATFSLICLSGISDDWSTYAGKVAAGESKGVVATKATNAGAMSTATTSPYVFTFDSATDVASAKFVDPTSFAMLVTTVQGGQTYYWASDVYSVSESSPNWTGTSKTYTMSTTVANAMGANGTNWTAAPVPEPATGALALAGIALLFKRRKARA